MNMHNTLNALLDIAMGKAVWYVKRLLTQMYLSRTLNLLLLNSSKVPHPFNINNNVSYYAQYFSDG